MKHAYIYDEQKDFYSCLEHLPCVKQETRASIFMKHLGVEPLIVNPQTWELSFFRV